jgi:hypothetical protein
MRRNRRPTVALTAILALVLTGVSPGGSAPQSTSRLEGLVLDIDGRPAAGWGIHLIDEEGHAVARADTDSGGFYSFREVESGRYALGIESPEGLMSPVDAPPVLVRDRELSRRDLKLMSAEEGEAGQTAHGNYGLGHWWAGLTPAAKAWTIVAIVVVAGVTVALLADDTPQASDFQPATAP